MKYLNGFIGAGFLSLFVGACDAQDPAPPAEVQPTEAAAAPASLNLGNYKLVLGPKVLAVKENSSGLAYHAPSKTLYMVINGPCQLVQMDLTGEIKRTIGLAGFDDTEAVAWMGGKKFVVAEEDRKSVV